MELLLAAVPVALAIGYYLGYRMKKTDAPSKPEITSWEIKLPSEVSHD